MLGSHLIISEISACEGKLYFQLLKELNSPIKGLINIENEDNACLKWCLIR